MYTYTQTNSARSLIVDGLLFEEHVELPAKPDRHTPTPSRKNTQTQPKKSGKKAQIRRGDVSRFNSQHSIKEDPRVGGWT
eukprot:1226095-Amorphochlora_amoeboformis.AAC.1